MSSLSKDITESSLQIFKTIQRTSLNWPQISTFLQAWSLSTLIFQSGHLYWMQRLKLCPTFLIPLFPSLTQRGKKGIWFLLKRPRINSFQSSCSASPSSSPLFSPKNPDAELWKQVAVGGNRISFSKGLNKEEDGGGRRWRKKGREGQKRETKRRGRRKLKLVT